MSDDLHIGELLGGKYRVDELIGQGGMGVVARATQLGTNRRVAVKSLRPEVRGHAEVLERFYREARAAARIKGEHAVEILDVGRRDAGDPYLVMELLEGEDLDRVIRREGRQRVEVAAALMMQACSGVAAAHEMRIVHRDLKPSNLFLARLPSGNKVLKVLDFGISRLDDQASQLTRTTTQLGTPHYMSPEQIERPKSVDHRTDIWAMGCIFHKLLVGETPFRGQGMQLISAVVRNTRKRPSELVPGLGAAVDAVVDKCLEPNPDKRYQTATELGEALRALIDPTNVGAQVLSVPAATRGQRPSDRPPSSIRTDAGVSVHSLPVAAPHIDADGQTAIQVEVEHTLALSPPPPVGAPFTAPRSTSPALMRTQLMAPPRSRVPEPETPSPASSPRMPEALIPPPPPSDPRPSIAPGSLTPSPHLNRPTTLSPSLRIQGLPPPAARVQPRRSKAPIVVGALTFAAILAGGLVAAPRLIAGKARSAAALAGVTLTYDSVKPSLDGWELSNFNATVAAAPEVKVHAARARYGLSMDTLTLEDVELTVGRETGAVANAVEALQKGDLRSIEARNVHFKAEGVDVRLEGWDGHVTIKRTDPPQTAAEAAKNDRLALEVESRRLTVSALGVELSGIGGHLEGTRSHGTFTGAIPPGSQDGLTLHGSYDEAGVYASLGAPRQKVSSALIQVSSFEAVPAADHELELTLDVRTDQKKGITCDLAFTVFGLSTGAGATFDLASQVSFHGPAHALVVDSGKMKLGPFKLIPAGTVDTDHGVNVTLSGDGGAVSCADLRRAKAAKLPSINGVNLADAAFAGEPATTGNLQISATVKATMDQKPKLAVTLTKAETCGLPIFATK